MCCIKVQLWGECDCCELGNSWIALVVLAEWVLDVAVAAVIVVVAAAVVDRDNPAPSVLVRGDLGCGSGGLSGPGAG